MRPGHRAAVVQDALQRINWTLLDLEDQLDPATGDRPPATAWGSALDDFHTVLIELASLATVLQPDLNAVDAAPALADASAAIGTAAKVIAAARESIKPR